MKTYRSNIFVLFFSLICLLSTTKKFQPNMEIKIGHHIFNANLSTNTSAIKFKALLPLNLNMIELNGNEKYASLPISLPVNHEKVNKIKAGDIMLYGDDTLVIFYKDFSTPYSYTRLGHITDTTALVKALGSGNIPVNFR